jgi:DNA-binding NtrC family response regulator
MLTGKRVLVVEDEYYIADDMRRMIAAAGATVVGPCSTLAKADAAVKAGDFDCAVIDLNLAGESAIPIAERLMDEGRGFAISTGYGAEALPRHLRDVPRIEKPYDPSALLDLLSQLSCARPG